MQLSDRVRFKIVLNRDHLYAIACPHGGPKDGPVPEPVPGCRVCQASQFMMDTMEDVKDVWDSDTQSYILEGTYLRGGSGSIAMTRILAIVMRHRDPLDLFEEFQREQEMKRGNRT